MMVRDSVPDPNGAAEEPECGQMQDVADRLRALQDGEVDAERRAAIIAGADMLELAIDWLVEQHRIIAQVQGRP